MSHESLDGGLSHRRDGQHGQRSQPRLRVLFLGLAAILTFFGAVGLVLYLKPGGDSPAPAIFVAGPVEGFEPGSVTYFESDHVFIVRLTDGALLALYDLGPRMQDAAAGDYRRLQCRDCGLSLPQSTTSSSPAWRCRRRFRETGASSSSATAATGMRPARPSGVRLTATSIASRFSVVDGVVRWTSRTAAA